MLRLVELISVAITHLSLTNSASENRWHYSIIFDVTKYKLVVILVFPCVTEDSLALILVIVYSCFLLYGLPIASSPVCLSFSFSRHLSVPQHFSFPITASTFLPVVMPACVLPVSVSWSHLHTLLHPVFKAFSLYYFSLPWCISGFLFHWPIHITFILPKLTFRPCLLNILPGFHSISCS